MMPDPGTFALILVFVLAFLVLLYVAGMRRP